MARELVVPESQKTEIYEKIESSIDELRYLGVSTEEISGYLMKMIEERSSK